MDNSASRCEKHLNILLDTNVWLDFFLGRKPEKYASEILKLAIQYDHVITTTTSIMKDVFFSIGASLKRDARKSGVQVDEACGGAINEISWECISVIMKHSIILNQGFGEHLSAMSLKSDHRDYEDSLLLASTQDPSIDFLVTNDKQLLKSNIVDAIAPEKCIQLMLQLV